MAAEVSVSDVLCEAMDYLSKLGSNLKTRTDNLKEKRIRKDKLRNSHSVHKAANKVLLICELSKKSLENVEKGVRRILDKVVLTQATSSDGGNLGVNCNSETDVKFQQFYHGSRALRICKTVPVKHYMSAKVRVRNMSHSLQEKYPVYYDCKLYRIRRKKLKSKKEVQIGTENDKVEMHKIIQNKYSSTHEVCNSNKMNFLSSNDDPSNDNTVEQVQDVDITSRPLIDTFSCTQSAIASETSVLELIQENKDTENMLEVETVERLDKHMLEDNQTPLTNRESETCENLKNNCENIRNNTADESDSSDKDLIKVTAKVRSKKLTSFYESSDDNENVQSNDSKIKTSDVPAGDEEVVSENNKILVSKRKLNAIEPDNNDDDSKTNQTLLDINETPAIETNVISDDTKKNEELTTSHIKCVNIFKLLKPDILNNIQSKSEIKNISIQHSRSKSYKSIKTYSQNPQTCSLNNSKENELVNAKREEVLAFKPKKFVIKLHRLPSFSKALLHKYKLKRITQNGSVLCEVDIVDKKIIRESDVVKNLLNDSDTDDISIKILSTEGKLVKYALLHDSDSDNEESNNINGNRFARSGDQENLDSEARATSSKLLDEDISESHSCKPKKGMTETNRRKTLDENGISENIKLSLLDESDVDMPDVEVNNLMTAEILKSCNEHFGNISDTLNATKNSLELCNETHGTAQNMEKIKNSGASNLPGIKDNQSTLLKKCINSIDLDKQKPENNTCEYSDNNDFITNKKNLADNSVKGTSVEVSNSKVGTDENMKSQNELQITDQKKTLTDDNEKLKDFLLRESDSDEQPIDKMSKNNENNSEIVKSKVFSNVDSNDHDASKSTEGIEAPNNIENQSDNFVHHSGSIEKETNTVSNKNKDYSDLDKNESYNSNITKSITSDGKVNSNANENETKEEISPNKIKSSLLDSSDESQSDIKKNVIEPKLRRKRIRESIKARKMLLTNSSSSDDDDVPSNGRLKNHKNIVKMITEIVDEIETMKKITTSSSSGSSGEDLIKTLKKRKKDKLNRTKKSNKIAEDSAGSGSAVEDNQNVGENSNEQSDSSSSQMVRSKSKPGSSITHNSDTQDDKDVDRLTNLENLTNPSRRRGSTSTNNTEETVTTTSEKRKEMPKGPSLIGEELLNAESSSESQSEDENVNNEELPEVTLPSINNGIGHISKDDLLGDSDSSVSQNGKIAENTQEDSDEENVKSKRRKGNTISSDSEAGASRRRDRDVKLSDFEDSDDSSEATKRTKRIKKATDSDASMSSSDANKKKRRRIKQINESDLSDSDGETEGRNKHGRKNIRKVMGKNQLEEATKKAAREEKERIARIAERQKLYNNLEFDESGKPDEVVLEKVVLDFDPETKEPLIEVDRGLVKKLKPHQANGIKFMWDACFESVKRIKKDKGSGCILAHCMGLGKTLQVISLTHTLLTHAQLTGVRRVLVVCPLSTVLNWVNEFRMWLKHAETDFEVDVYELSKNKQNTERAAQLSQWFQDGGVCVLGYEMFRNLSADNNKKFKKKMLKSFQEALVDPGPDLVVCDEGHLLKNEKTSLSQSMNKVKTRRRIVLTGTPLQNNLKEYYCMVQFVKPNLLGKYNEYLNRFVNPITNGQYTDSTEQDIRVMKRRSHVLHKMLDGAVQRRDYGVLAPFLPPKHEYVLFITLSDVQIKLYQMYLDNYSRRPQPGKSSGFLFPDFQSLQRIWTHPLVLKYNSERYEIMQQKKREREEDDSEGSLVDFIDDDSTSEETSTEESTDVSSDMSDDSRKKSKKKKSSKKNKGKDKVSTRRGTRANPAMEQDEEDPVNDDVVEVKYENPTEWWVKLVSDDELEDIRNSHKLVLLFDILRQCDTIGDKLLVFSQSLYSLDLIEHFLGKVDEATQEGRMDEKLGGHFGSWSPGVDYFRLDGSTSCENRSIWCKNFNREDNPRARLFLISTRAGGLGINLVAANRVVIFDVSWNPSHDVQSIFRVYRFGQKKPCYVYRFLAMGTMEEKIYERQVTKQAISKRVIDEQQIDRHYAENDLAELYKFEPKPSEPRELPPLPKDRLFAEMLREHEAQIYKYHEHDSLLENKEEETLTEEERKAAWEDFENEKNRPPPSPFPAWPTHNGMMPNPLAQQQQAYAMLAAMMGKDITKINDAQLGDMLPLLYNSAAMFGGYDYGMMQKMNNYKYGQAGMMNPMMASVMNSAAGSGMGGTSGLQYEPPWQRHNQQQLRLQQLMQQQSSMGAKYYAGGLGSRDPVAMALQQQRAREFMLGGGGGGGGGTAGAGPGAGVPPIPGAGSRPRGRPPLRNRTATPTGPADVVNLDSD